MFAEFVRFVSGRNGDTLGWDLEKVGGFGILVAESELETE